MGDGDVRAATDWIHIRGVRIHCVIGVYPHERDRRQDLLADIGLAVELRAAGASDRLEETVDYDALTARILLMAEASSFVLVERLATRMAEVCLETDGVLGCRVVLEKPGALRSARTVAVEIERWRCG